MSFSMRPEFGKLTSNHRLLVNKAEPFGKCSFDEPTIQKVHSSGYKLVHKDRCRRCKNRLLMSRDPAERQTGKFWTFYCEGCKLRRVEVVAAVAKVAARPTIAGG